MTCEYCDSVGGDLLWEDSRSRVVLASEPGFPGFCRVIWRDHVREMTDLPDADRDAFMRVVFAVEAALRETLAPAKINLASLGNLTPHLHWHVIPRFVDDSHFPAPVWTAAQRSAPTRNWPVDWVECLGRGLERRLT
jgi:diadenosine tetraphosphate (Ap4A) HIT family hydrolase